MQSASEQICIIALGYVGLPLAVAFGRLRPLLAASKTVGAVLKPSDLVMLKSGLPMQRARVLAMGLTFKEDCPDLRNTRVIDVVRGLEDDGLSVHVHAPHADPDTARTTMGLELVETPQPGTYDDVILAGAHAEFRQLGGNEIRAYGTPDALLYDPKYILPPEASDLRL